VEIPEPALTAKNTPETTTLVDIDLVGGGASDALSRP
jgi:hypothetical protein